MSQPTSTDPVAIARERAKLRRTVLILAPILIVGGVAVLLFLDRIPLPLRLLMGFGDIVAGLVLLVLLRQILR